MTRPAALPALAPVAGELRKLIQQTTQIDLRTYEHASLDLLQSELVPRVCGTLDATLELTRALEEQVAAHREAPDVGDCAFVVRLELSQRRDRLSRLASRGHAVDVLAGCDSALRACVKCIRALGEAVRNRASTLPGYDSDLHDAIRIRTCYAHFRERVANLGAPGHDEASVRALLLRARQLIAVLVCSAEYPMLRIADRCSIRNLQTRMLDWLRADAPAPREGNQIWNDFTSYVDLLSQVSRREVLVEHDRQALSTLSTLTGPVMNADALATLQRLYGLDSELDRLIESQPPPLASDLRPVVNRLLLSRGCTSDGRS